MIAVSTNPSASRAARIAATWPSIIALGATMSAPARAWLTAVSRESSDGRRHCRHSRRRPTDRSGRGRCTRTGRCPRSPTIGSSSARIRRNACCTMPSSVRRSDPERVLRPRAGRTGARHRRRGRRGARPPRRRRRATSGRRRASSRSARRTRVPGRTNSGATSIEGWRRVSRTKARSAGVRRRRRGRMRPGCGDGAKPPTGRVSTSSIT